MKNPRLAKLYARRAAETRLTVRLLEADGHTDLARRHDDACLCLFALARRHSTRPKQ